MKAFQITRKTQAGMTLTESLLVLAVGALVAVLAYGGYKVASGNVSEKSAVESTARLLTSIKKAFGGSGNYTTNVTTANLAKSGIVPTDFKSDTAAGTVAAPWGTGTSMVTIAGTGTAAVPVNTVPVTLTNVPASICLAIMSGVEGLAEGIKAGPAATIPPTNVIKTPGSAGSYDAGAAAAQCGADAAIEITLK
ncbi:MAG: prepilin-type N-terminal cleavage/methylation domain-containing protein [Burkholderiales bacterium]|nr:prepilin-type N-terminal cleavage/methylation domain-containing protein [Burkholderiales bacterium]